MAQINLQKIAKTYPGMTRRALDDMTLTIERGEIISLLGPSGCGKTTALRLIAGFERPDYGSICLNEKEIVGDKVWVPPEKRQVGMVFQDYALFPHLNVEKNIGFALSKGKQTARKISEMLDLTGLTGLERQFPHQLSGGQQQRVALARALVRDPAVVLLDEPFSNLDADFRERMRRETLAIIRQTKATAVFVTHDQTEALVISDRIAVMNHGRIQQLDTPENIYRFPENEFTATFVGQSNLLPGVIGLKGDSIETLIGSVPCRHTHGYKPGHRVICSIRPNSLIIKAGGMFSGRLIETVFRGTLIEATAEVPLPNGKRQKLLFHLHPEQGLKCGDPIEFNVMPQFVSVVEPESAAL